MDATVKLFQWALLLFSVTIAKSALNIKDFTMMPTMQKGSVSVELEEGITCTIMYQATGGTQEVWYLQIEHVSEDQVMCTLYRGQASYLYVESFSLRLFGVKSITHHETINTQTTPLSQTEYKLDNEKKMLYSISGFQHHLEKVILVGKSQNSEL